MKDILISPVSDYWIIMQDFTVWSDYMKKPITVTKGTKTDIKIIPFIFRIFFRTWGNHTRASIVHCFLYKQKLFSRKDSDKIFLEIMIKDKVKKKNAKIMYFCVRWFGWYIWRKIK